MSKFSNISIPANRFKAMLQMIPREPNKTCTEELRRKLCNAGFEVDLRTVQRNLKALCESREFGLTSERNGRESMYWYYRADAPVTIFPSMDDHTALAFKLADTFLQSMIPPDTVLALRPFVQEADKHLAKHSQAAIGKWTNKIHVFPQGVRRRAPTIRKDVREQVYQALLDEKPLRLVHKSRGKPEAREFIVSPYGLVIRGYLIYLYGLTKEKKQMLAFALNRTQSAEIPDDEVFDQSEAGFYLADNEHLVSMPKKGEKEKIDLKLRITADLAYSLQECPLVSKQTLCKAPDTLGEYILSALVPNTVELRQWIRSLGPNAEVLEPTFLRSEIVEEIAALARRYCCVTTPTS